MSLPNEPKPQRTPWRLSAHALSNTRLALVACTLLATVAVLLVVTLEARDGQVALDDAASHTLRDYSGYAGRMLGADVLRRFSEQRAMILSPVTGGSHRDVPAPRLEDLERLANANGNDIGSASDSARGYYRVDVRTGQIETRGGVPAAYAKLIADTVRIVAPRLTAATLPGIIALEVPGGAYSVTYAPYFNAQHQLVSVYGYAYTRNIMLGAVATRAFREVPLLPVSFAGIRWNYDTTRVRAGEITNDALLAIRISDRRGRELWETPDAARYLANSPYGSRTVLSTNAGGIIVESAMLPNAEPSLIPSVVRRAQRWTLRGLIALSLLLVMVSLIALRGERSAARARRVEAMEQLALGIRHEINNALASVLLNAELLKEERSMDEEQRERLEAIVEQAERMRKVVRRLEHSERLDKLVPYLNTGLMVDLSTSRDRDGQGDSATQKTG